jgi:hypothetical protein
MSAAISISELLISSFPLWEWRAWKITESPPTPPNRELSSLHEWPTNRNGKRNAHSSERQPRCSVKSISELGRYPTHKAWTTDSAQYPIHARSKRNLLRTSNARQQLPPPGAHPRRLRQPRPDSAAGRSTSNRNPPNEAPRGCPRLATDGRAALGPAGRGKPAPHDHACKCGERGRHPAPAGTARHRRCPGYRTGSGARAHARGSVRASVIPREAKTNQIAGDQSQSGSTRKRNDPHEPEQRRKISQAGRRTPRSNHVGKAPPRQPNQRRKPPAGAPASNLRRQPNHRPGIPPGLGTRPCPGHRNPGQAHPEHYRRTRLPPDAHPEGLGTGKIPHRGQRRSAQPLPQRLLDAMRARRSPPHRSPHCSNRSLRVHLPPPIRRRGRRTPRSNEARLGPPQPSAFATPSGTLARPRARRPTGTPRPIRPPVLEPISQKPHPSIRNDSTVAWIVSTSQPSKLDECSANKLMKMHCNRWSPSIFVSHLRQRREHHQDEADRDRNGRGSSLKAVDQAGPGRNEVTDSNPDRHCEKYPKRQEAVKKTEASCAQPACNSGLANEERPALAGLTGCCRNRGRQRSAFKRGVLRRGAASLREARAVGLHSLLVA